MDIFSEIDDNILYWLNFVEPNETIKINSSGGDVFSALAAYNLLKNKNVTIEIVGLCASAATLIACAGSKVIMHRGGLMMIHAPGVLLEGMYNQEKLSALQSTLEKINESIMAIYRTRCADFEITGEIWLNADEAKARGFIDEIDETPTKTGEKMLLDLSARKFISRATTSFDSVIMDNIKSGAGNVKGSMPTPNQKAHLINLIAKVGRNLK